MKSCTVSLALCLSLCLPTAVLAQPQGLQRSPLEKPTVELIKQLGSEVPAERESASEQLMRRPEAIPLLRQALASPDAEVVRRATRILEGLAHREEELNLKRLQHLGTNGDADQIVERLVRQPKGKDTDASWQVVTDLAARLVALDKATFMKEIEKFEETLPFGDFGRYRAKNGIDFTVSGSISISRPGRRFIVRADSIHLATGLGGVFVTSGRITSKNTGGIGGSVVLANDSAEFASVTHSVIVCGGDVTIKGSVTNVIIVARGKVLVRELVNESLIATASTFEAPYKPRGLSSCTIREKEAEPMFGLIRFFDPARAGIEVVLAQDRLDVKTVAKDKPFARAGMRPGDVVLAVDGTDVASVESFRKLLRRAVATQSEVSLKVRRDGEVHSVNVPLGD